VIWFPDEMWISTASGSERGSRYAPPVETTLATARGTDPTHQVIRFIKEPDSLDYAEKR